jgi:hypothetical protein
VDTTNTSAALVPADVREKVWQLIRASARYHAKQISAFDDESAGAGEEGSAAEHDGEGVTILPGDGAIIGRKEVAEGTHEMSMGGGGAGGRGAGGSRDDAFRREDAYRNSGSMAAGGRMGSDQRKYTNAGGAEDGEGKMWSHEAWDAITEKLLVAVTKRFEDRILAGAEEESTVPAAAAAAAAAATDSGNGGGSSGSGSGESSGLSGLSSGGGGGGGGHSSAGTAGPSGVTVELSLEGLSELLHDYTKQTAQRLEGLKERQLELVESKDVWYSSLLRQPMHKDYGTALRSYQIDAARASAEAAINLAGGDASALGEMMRTLSHTPHTPHHTPCTILIHHTPCTRVSLH